MCCAVEPSSRAGLHSCGARERVVALVLAVAWFSGGARSLAETPKNSGPEVFVEAFQRYLQDTASKCAATPEFLALEQQRYAWEREINSRKAPPRDVICFSYAGNLKAFKADLKASISRARPRPT